MDETTEIKKTWGQLIPRKIIGGIAAMYILWQAAVAMKDAASWQFGLTMVCMTLLGVIAIWTHYLLERGPKKPKDERRWTRDEYCPDLPDSEQGTENSVQT